jgi:hypothetical protein
MRQGIGELVFVYMTFSVIVSYLLYLLILRSFEISETFLYLVSSLGTMIIFTAIYFIHNKKAGNPILTYVPKEEYTVDQSSNYQSLESLTNIPIQLGYTADVFYSAEPAERRDLLKAKQHEIRKIFSNKMKSEKPNESNVLAILYINSEGDVDNFMDNLTNEQISNLVL